jgi:hypothetical protein
MDLIGAVTLAYWSSVSKSMVLEHFLWLCVPAFDDIRAGFGHFDENRTYSASACDKHVITLVRNRVCHHGACALALRSEIFVSLSTHSFRETAISARCRMIERA